MPLQLDERSYSGKTFRPRPEIHIDSQLNLVIVATPWGPRSGARKVIERMTDYLSLARSDREVTSPFQRLSCLSSSANNLRIATLLANETLYREDNSVEYRSGVELFCGILEGGEFSWLQAGNPQILLSRKNRSLLPLGSQIDLSFDLSEGDQLLAAIPSQLLGLDSTLNLSINSFRARDEDRLVLLSHSHLPEKLFALRGHETSLDHLSKRLSEVHPDHAFWLGILSISGSRMEAL